MNCLITGGTSGVGLSIAECALEKGYRVILVGSNDHSCLETQQQLEKKYPAKPIDCFATDLSTLDGVNNLVQWLDETVSHIDLLMNCAGIITVKHERTSEGIERNWATNYLSVLRVSLLCLPLLKKSESGRIITVSGLPLSLKGARMQFDDIESQHSFSATKAILQSILARVLLTYKLADELDYCDIRVHTFHPGFVQSKLTRYLPWILHYFAKLVSPLLASKSKTGCYLLDAPETFDQTGHWFVNCKPVKHKLKQVNQENMDALWQLNEQYLNATQKN